MSLHDMRAARVLAAMIATLGSALACGDNLGVQPEADGAAGPPPVSLTVLSFRGTRLPQSGQLVAFYDPDGTLVATAETDSEGKASAQLDGGGTVLLFTEGVTLPVVDLRQKVGVAVVGVQPGDDIVLGGPDETDIDFDVAGSMAIDIDPHPEFAVWFEGLGTCAGGFSWGFGTPPPVFTTYAREGCESFDMVGLAHGPSGPIAYFEVDDAPFIDGSTYTVTEGWSDMPEVTVDFSNLSDIGDEVRAMIYEIRLEGGFRRQPAFGQRCAEITGTSASLSLIGLPSQESALALSIPGGSMIQWLAPGSTAIAIDAAALPVPHIDDATWDSATRRFRWTVTGEQVVDATYVLKEWSTDEGATEWVWPSEIAWHLVVPPGVDQVTLPAFPEEAADWLPAGAVPSRVTTVTVIESSEVGWDAVRPLGIDPTRSEWALELGTGATTWRTGAYTYQANGVE